MMHLNLDHSQAKQAQQFTGLTMKLRWMILVWTLFYFNVDQTNANASEGEFFRIFNGKTLEGWSPSFPQASEAWYVRDGYIVGEGKKGRCYLIYDGNRDIADFELKFSYRFPGEGNSGVNIRAVKDPTGKRDYQAYHVDLGHAGIGGKVLGAWDFHTPGRIEHRCFRGDKLIIREDDSPVISPLKDAVQVEDIKKHDWNTVHVIVRGNQFQFSINGKPAAQFEEHLPKSRRLKSGMIQFQLHDPDMIIHFKDIELKILDRVKTE